MSDDVDAIRKDRSPRAPIISLQEALELAKKLRDQIGRSSVKVETAAKALGYTGITGSALSMLATLSQYRLIDREKGQVSISPLAVRILHPTGARQLQDSLREAALAPSVIEELFDGYRDCSEEVITSHLVQSGFNFERARRVAAVYTANKSFAKLDSPGIVTEQMRSEHDSQFSTVPQVSTSTSSHPDAPSSTILAKEQEAMQKAHVLARYSIPLGANEATLVFTGESLSPADFDALIEYVELFKKQFQRRSATASAAPEPSPAKEVESEQ
jgi:hypothetical protein